MCVALCEGPCGLKFQSLGIVECDDYKIGVAFCGVAVCELQCMRFAVCEGVAMYASRSL